MFFCYVAQLFLREDTILARVDPSRGNHSPPRRTPRAASIHTRRSAPVRTLMTVRALPHALLSTHTAQHCSTARKVKCRNTTSLPELDDAMRVCAYSTMWQPFELDVHSLSFYHTLLETTIVGGARAVSYTHLTLPTILLV